MKVSRNAFRFAAVWLVVLALLLGACGDDDDDDSGSGDTPTATTAAAAATTAPTEAATEATDDATPTEAAMSTAEPSTPTTAASTATTAPAASPTESQPALSGSMTVFAAASLTDAFADIATAMNEIHPDLEITFNFAGSQQLATQLADGADAEVFASANQTQMTAAQDADVIDSEPIIFTQNRLAIIVPADNPAGLSEPADLANDGLKLVVALPEVPVGRYTLEMLDKMSADAEFGADFRAQVESNIVSQEENVRQVVTKVQLGEADAGVVYVSDVTPDVSGDVTIIEVPTAFNILAAYPIATVVDGDSELAQAFIDFVLSDEGQAILIEWGFTPLDES